MIKTDNIIDAKNEHIKSLKRQIIFLSAIIIAVIVALYMQPSKMRISIPPDLRSGVEQGVGEIHPHDVYSFAFVIWQALNTWKTDGLTDGEANINAYQFYLAPSFISGLKKAHKERNIEAKNRTRTMTNISGFGYTQSRVQVLVPNKKWVVYLDVNINEFLNSLPVKNTSVRYPIIVEFNPTNLDNNPWGMQLVGYETTPRNLISSAKKS